MNPTTLHRSPFWILGATIRDDRRRIVELAEEMALHLDHEACQKARADLTSPRTRLSAELGWLPGVSPRRASELVVRLEQSPMSVRLETGIPCLAHANLLAAAAESIGPERSALWMADFIEQFAYLADDLDPEAILREINEDRAVSGFPRIQSVEAIAAELAQRRRYFRTAIKGALDRLPSSVLVTALATAVSHVTDTGEHHALGVLDDLVDAYEVEAQTFLELEGANVETLISKIRQAAAAAPHGVPALISQLEAVVRNWDWVAQPVQLNAEVRGIEHEASHELAYLVRALAVDLFNEHGLLESAKQLTALVRELFAELPEVVERVEEDSHALQRIANERRQSEAQQAKWKREITYRAELGVFKARLEISPDGVTWKNRTFPLDSVARLRWGGVRHSINGIPTGTTYTIAFGDAQSEAVVALDSESIFEAFTERLWQAVGSRMLRQTLEMLRAGREIRIGGITVRDDAIALRNRAMFKGNSLFWCQWRETKAWSASGSFFIGSRTDDRVYESASYIEQTNTHVLEQAIQLGYKRGVRRLSDVLP
jgi:hypothetical protein